MGLLGLLGGFVGKALEEGAEAVVSNAIIREIADIAVDSARDKAANEGQDALLDACIDGWREYAIGAMRSEGEVSSDELLALTSHPEAIGEIASEFADECNDAYSAEQEVVQGAL